MLSLLSILFFEFSPIPTPPTKVCYSVSMISKTSTPRIFASLPAVSGLISCPLKTPQYVPAGKPADTISFLPIQVLALTSSSFFLSIFIIVLLSKIHFESLIVYYRFFLNLSRVFLFILNLFNFIYL